MSNLASTTLLQDITAANRRLMDCFRRGDAVTMAQCYTEDAQLLVPHAEVIKGRAALEAIFKRTSSQRQVYEFVTVELDGDGSAAFEIGEYRRTDAAGQLLDRGKYIVRWKRVDGDWKIHRDMLSTSLPA